MEKLVAIVPAAGAGKRLGLGINKAFAELRGAPLIVHCLAMLARTKLVREAIVVLAPAEVEEGSALLARYQASYFATLPIKSIVDAIRAEGLPAAVSNSAGTFVCNHLMYCVLHALEDSATRAGFIHVPCLPEQAAGHPGIPSMPLSDMIRGIEAVLKIL